MRARPVTVLAVSMVCAAVGGAAAQPAATAPAPAGGNQDTDVAQIDDLRDHDAAAGRAYLAGTAITAPEGTWTIGLRQPTAPIGSLSLSYAIDDRVELGVGLAYTTDVGSDNTPVAPSVSIKAQVARSRELALAVETGYEHVPGGGGVTYVSAMGSACLSDRDCVLLASGHVTALLVPPDGDGRRETVILGGGSITAGSHSTRFLAELDVIPVDANEHAATAIAGVRFTSPHAALDIGGGVVVVPDDDLVVVPALLLAGSLRF
jgi:hypothetical protein